MANTKIGAQKTAAHKLGISVQEYQQNINSGLKWCWRCRNFKRLDLFNRNWGSVDSRTNCCRSCQQAKDRARYKPVPPEERKPRGFAAHPPRDGDKQQARNRVNREIRKGNLPHAQTVPCTDCGHIGHNRLHEYDHYLGYAAINHLVVECVCVPCHNRREQQRRKQEKVNEN